MPEWHRIGPRLRTILESGRLTNGATVRELEERVADYLRVPHAIAVSSCTTGLMLVVRVLGVAGRAIIPSFTFVATAHAASWNGLTAAFADCRRDTLTLDTPPADDDASVVIATHVFGTPCDVDALEAFARERNLRLVFDAAHAFGSRTKDRPVGGFGDAEVFSLTPTKPVVAGEGGIIATRDDELARLCRIGRDYGNPGDYDTQFVGLNGRMSEVHAALAIESLDSLEARIIRRNEIARQYVKGLVGVSFPVVPEGDRSAFKDFTILVENGRDEVRGVLASRGIETRTYYSPPLHRQTAYRNSPRGPLDITEWAAERVLTLPLWSEMEDADVDYVIGAVGDAVSTSS